MESNYSLADIRAATHDNDNDGWGGGDGGWFWIVVLFLFMFGFGGNGMWGNNGALNGALTRADLCQDMNFQQLENGVRGIQQGLCDGFYAQNTTMLQGFSGLGMQVAENRFAAQQCCCETNRNIDATRYDAQKNTCEITTAIHAEGEQTRALINANTMQNLRDKLADKDRDILARDIQLSQIAQTNSIVDQIRPCPIPAYQTCNPWGCNGGFGRNGFGRCGSCSGESFA